jgi:mono/diheme cytochrome c family protein
MGAEHRGGIMKRIAITGGLFVAALTAALVADTPSGVRAQDAALIAKGQKVYEAQKCSVCHAIAGKGNKQNPLDGVGSKFSADEIRQWIVDPVEMAKKANSTKKPPMPAKYKLPAGDLDALVAYMQSLKK